jgi:hypothetical protein
MMYFLLRVSAAFLGVESVLGQTKNHTFSMYQGKKLSINGSTTQAKRVASGSVGDCSIRCLADDDCVAANYEDGVCHMSSGGQLGLVDSDQTTAIVASSEGNGVVFDEYRETKKVLHYTKVINSIGV